MPEEIMPVLTHQEVADWVMRHPNLKSPYTQDSQLAQRDADQRWCDERTTALFGGQETRSRAEYDKEIAKRLREIKVNPGKIFF